MKTVLMAVICIAAGLGLGYIIIPSNPTAAPVEAGSSVKQLYTCGMHPEIISEEPGYCPICGMKLTPKKDGAATSGLMIDPVTTQNMGLVTVPAGYESIKRSVTAFGKAGYNESEIYSVNLKREGWVEKIHAAYEGERVTRGQVLLEVYSPDLTAAQQEFLAVEKSLSGASSNEGLKRMKQAARERLKNWDISDAQVDRLIATGEVTRTIDVVSPATGIVISKKANEGDHLRAGMELYRIADLSSIWVTVHIYEQDLPFVDVGYAAQVTFPNMPGKVYAGTVSYVSPYLDGGRQAELRIELDNSEGRIKPDMYAEVTVQSELPGRRLVIPRSAVINSGKRTLVYIASGSDAYLPRDVTIGAVGNGDLIEIISGLEAGDRVVISGQFLLDSESRLSEALGDGHTHQHGEQMDKPDPMEGGSHEGHEPAEADNGIYTCPMPSHYHILQFGPGECSECGMKLAPVEETDNTDFYTCPMTQCGVAQSEPGRCPVCNMKLVKYEPEAGHDK